MGAAASLRWWNWGWGGGSRVGRILFGDWKVPMPSSTGCSFNRSASANRLVNYVTAEPFRSFRINLTGGDTFEIRRPEMVQVGRTTATIFTWMSDDAEDQKEREREISIILIESIEPLRSPSPHNQTQSIAE
jgi:hypothetical protein